MRINKTERNLQAVWDKLDEACGLLDNAFMELGAMTKLPSNIKDSIEAIDITAITSLKSDIEELIEEVNNK